MELLKLLSTNEIVAQIISFLVLFFLLRAFAWKKILWLLDERRNRIASELQGIEENKNEITRLKAEYGHKLSSIDEEVKHKLQEAVVEARKATEEIKKKAHQDAQAILENAKENIKVEMAKAESKLKERVVDLAIRATEHLIQQKLTEEQDKRMVDEFLEEIDKP